MFPVTITLHNPAQMNAVMAALGGQVPAAVSVPAQAEAPKTQKAETKKAEPKTSAATPEQAHTPEAQSSEQTSAAAGNSTTSSSESGGAEASAPTYQDAATAVTKLSRAKGREAAVGVLAQFEAAKLPDVKPEQFAAVIAACEEALA